VWRHGVHALEGLLHNKTLACHGTTQHLHFPYSPTRQSRHRIHSSTTPCSSFSRGSWLMLRHWLVHELAHSAGVHACHTPDCMNLVPVLLTWHSTLYHRHPLHRTPASGIDYLGRVGQGNGLNTRYLLHLPQQLNLSASTSIACAATLY
jgi:hypothetical protein